MLAQGADSESHDDGAVTDRLLEDEETVRCWTCGSEVRRREIDDMIDRLRSHQEEKRSERDKLEDRIESLRTERREIDQTKRKHERVQDRLADVKNEIERRETRLEELTDQQTELEDKIAQLEDETAELESESDSTSEDEESLLELNRRANELEFSPGRLECDLETMAEEIRGELENLCTRIDRIEQDAVESFNEHMDAILDVLEYKNIDRIWTNALARRSARAGARSNRRHSTSTSSAVPKSGAPMRTQSTT